MAATVTERTDSVAKLNTILAAPDITPDDREVLAAQKARILRQYFSGVTARQVVVLEKETLREQMLQAQCAEEDIRQVEDALDEGVELDGFAAAGRVFIVAENIRSLDQARLTCIHEGCHLYDYGEGRARLEALADSMSDAEAYAYLAVLSRDASFYAGRSRFSILAEAAAYATERAASLKEWETVRLVLGELGIENEEFINIINDNENGKRYDNNLSYARIPASLGEGLEYGEQTSERNASQSSGMEREGAPGPSADTAGDVPLSPVELLGRLNKNPEGRYPTVGELEALASSEAFRELAASQMPMRINRQTLPVITKWFDAWYEQVNSVDSIAEFRPVISDTLTRSETEDGTVIAGSLEEERKVFLEYIDALESNALQLAAAKWFCNGSVALPEDIEKVRQALDVAKAHSEDPHRYASPMELINKYPKSVKSKKLDPDAFPESFTDKKVLANGFILYHVTNEGREDMRAVMNSTLGPDRSPWCLLQADKEGKLTPSSANYWRNYSKISKMAVFHANDRGEKIPVGFHANSKRKCTVWNLDDQPFYDCIALKESIPGSPEDKKENVLYHYSSGELYMRPRYLTAGTPEFREEYRRYFGKDPQEKYFKDGRPVRLCVFYSMDRNVEKVYCMNVSTDSYSPEKGDFITFHPAAKGERPKVQSIGSGHFNKNGKIVQNYGQYESYDKEGYPTRTCTYTEEAYRGNKVYIGDLQTYWPGGHGMRKVQHFDNSGKPNGRHTEYYEARKGENVGPVKTLAEYDHGELISYHQYAPNGSLTATRDGDDVTLYYPTTPGEAPVVKTVCPNASWANAYKGKTKLVSNDRKETFHRNGLLKKREEYKAGSSHPAYTEQWDDNGRLVSEEWYRDNDRGHLLKLYTVSPEGRSELTKLILSLDGKKSLAVEIDSTGIVSAQHRNMLPRDDKDSGPDRMFVDGSTIRRIGNGNYAIERYVRNEKTRSLVATEEMALAFITDDGQGLFDLAEELVRDNGTERAVDAFLDRYKKDEDLPFRVEGTGREQKAPESPELYEEIKKAYYYCLNTGEIEEMSEDLRTACLNSERIHGQQLAKILRDPAAFKEVALAEQTGQTDSRKQHFSHLLNANVTSLPGLGNHPFEVTGIRFSTPPYADGKPLNECPGWTGLDASWGHIDSITILNSEGKEITFSGERIDRENRLVFDQKGATVRYGIETGKAEVFPHQDRSEMQVPCQTQHQGQHRGMH